MTVARDIEYIKDFETIMGEAQILNNHSDEVVIVPKAKEEPSARELIGYLREKLESYKIPQEFQVIRKIPMTASGKKQRDKLK